MEKDIFVFVRIHNDGQASKWLCLDIEDTRILLVIPLCIMFAGSVVVAAIDAAAALLVICFFVCSTLSKPFYFTWPVDDGEYCAVRCLFVIFSSFAFCPFSDFSRQK